jgi:hypothetical protein
MSGHHMSGHQQRTLYLTHIPASCPRNVLVSAVTAAVSEASAAVAQLAAEAAAEAAAASSSSSSSQEGGQAPAVTAVTQVTAVERVAVAPPSWSNRGFHFNFGRYHPPSSHLFCLSSLLSLSCMCCMHVLCQSRLVFLSYYVIYYLLSDLISSDLI